MQTNQITSKNYLRGLALIHALLIIGLLLFFGVTIFLHSNGLATDNSGELTRNFQIIIPLLAMGSIGGGFYVANMQLKNAVKQSDLKKKLKGYQLILIIKFAVIEGPALFGIVAYMVTANTFFVLIAILLIVILFLQRPTKSRLIDELELSNDEITLINDPNTIVGETRF